MGGKRMPPTRVKGVRLPAELVIASDVFANALSPTSKGANGVPNNVAKFMAISAAEGVRQTAKKTWTAMVERGGPALLLAQMRSLANATAKKRLKTPARKGWRTTYSGRYSSRSAGASL